MSNLNQIARRVAAACEAMRAGLPVVLMDDETRENEADLIAAAETLSHDVMGATLRPSLGIQRLSESPTVGLADSPIVRLSASSALRLSGSSASCRTDPPPVRLAEVADDYFAEVGLRARAGGDWEDRDSGRDSRRRVAEGEEAIVLDALFAEFARL